MLRKVTIKLLYPTFPLILLATVFPTTLLLLLSSARKRRGLTRLIGVKESWLWYVIQSLKILALLSFIVASGVPVRSVIAEKIVQGMVESEKLYSIVENLTAVHVIIVDESRSMLYTDGSNYTRFQYALKFIESYLDQLYPGDQVLIIGFAKDPVKICVGNASTCRGELEKLNPTKRYSNLSGALSYAYNYAEASQYPAIFVVVSDGVYNYGGDPYNVFLFVNQSGYPVLFVRVGLDHRANEFVSKLTTSGFKVFNINPHVEEAMDRESLMKLVSRTVRELRTEAFIRRRLLTIKIPVEERDLAPTLTLLVVGLVAYLTSRTEGF